jgi:hypothetical protein
MSEFKTNKGKPETCALTSAKLYLTRERSSRRGQDLRERKAKFIEWSLQTTLSPCDFRPRVLATDPVDRRAGIVSRAAALRDNALEANAARLLEYFSAIRIDMFFE